MPTYCEKVILFDKDDGINFIDRMRMIPLLFLCLGLQTPLPSSG